MNQDKENFLDKSSLFAIVLLGISWLIWDSHMKKKYPRTLPAQTDKELLSKQKPIKKLKLSQKKAVPFVKEHFYKYSGKTIELVFSSKGFGVSEFKLKNFFDPQGQPVFFKSPDRPFFATSFPERGVIPFQIKREGNKYKGIFKEKGLRLTKTIEVDEKKLVLKTKIDIQATGKAFPKILRTSFNHTLSQKKEINWFVKMLTIYGQDIFKGFVFFDGKKNLFREETLEKKQKYPRFSVAALGGKYFGTAFVNQSPLLPTMSVKKEGDKISAQIDYRFISNKPVQLDYLSFFGPKSFDKLNPLHKEAKSWIDFGFFSWLAHPLLSILKILYKGTHNWGFSIVLLTFLIRFCLLPVNIKSYQSMKIMQTIQPEINRLREEHKKDPKKLNLEIMALMKEKKASPFGGCLPLLFQFPVFFALYRVLGESIELYQSPFVFWIQDLSSKDPYYLLPILGGLVLFVQQKITPMNVPPAQARLLTFMPLLFSIFMLSLPSGLTLYIFVSGLFGLVQQSFFVKLKKK